MSRALKQTLTVLLIGCGFAFLAASAAGGNHGAAGAPPLSSKLAVGTPRPGKSPSPNVECSPTQCGGPGGGSMAAGLNINCQDLWEQDEHTAGDALAPNSNYTDLKTAFAALDGTPSGVVRVTVAWYKFEEEPGTYSGLTNPSLSSSSNIDWQLLSSEADPNNKANPNSFADHLQACLALAHAHHQEVLATFTGTPKWASCDASSSEPVPQCENQANGVYVGDTTHEPMTTTVPHTFDPGVYAAAVKHLLAEFPPTNATYGINAVEVWNEAGNNQFWTGGGTDYATLLCSAHPKIQAATAITVMSETSHIDTAWLRTELKDANADSNNVGCADAIGLHPYPAVNPDRADDVSENQPADSGVWTDPALVLNGTIDGLTQTLDNFWNVVNTVGQGQPIWITEEAWDYSDTIDDQSGKNEPSPQPQIGESGQAAALTNFYNYLWNCASTDPACADVAVAMWWPMWEPSSNTAESVGLTDGTPLYGDSLLSQTFAKKQAWSAFAALTPP